MGTATTTYTRNTAILLHSSHSREDSDGFSTTKVWELFDQVFPKLIVATRPITPVLRTQSQHLINWTVKQLMLFGVQRHDGQSFAATSKWCIRHVTYKDNMNIIRENQARVATKWRECTPSAGILYQTRQPNRMIRTLPTSRATLTRWTMI